MHLQRTEFGFFAMGLVVATVSLVDARARWKKEMEPDYRLPTDFRPISYDLTVITHLDDCAYRFEGLVRIKMLCVHGTGTVLLHTSKLYIWLKNVSLTTVDGDVVKTDVVNVPVAELLHVFPRRDLKAGQEYLLTIPFAGNIGEDPVGYYRSSYVDEATNETRWLAVTGMGRINARRAFPCFDEPALKAKFKIRIGHRKNLTAVSNMPLKKTLPLSSYPGYVVDEFEESVPMSTYLVSYMVSDFAHVECDSRGSVTKFRIFARKDAIGRAGLVRKLAPSVSRYYEEYFDKKLSLAKQDLVALPDFSAGNMDNWGIVTYSEKSLLLDPKEATIHDIHSVAKVIANKLAHQWFGNLVTMKWLSELWLKESFAIYFAARGIDFLYPEWNSFQVTTVLNYIRVLELDSLQMARPVSRIPNEMAHIFGTSYKKGSYLLYMMNGFLGEETFKQGLRNYIQKYKYKYAEQIHFWDVLTDEAHRRGSLNKSITLDEIMDTWTLQSGYPVVKAIRDYSANTVTLSQTRFRITKSTGTDESSCWWVPLTMTSSSKLDFNKTKADMWLNCKEAEVTIPLSNTEDWIILNVRLTGLYRVLYDDKNLRGIMKTLRNPDQYEKIHTMNRVQLIEDAFTFAMVGHQNYWSVFRMLRYLKHEHEYMPWLAALNGLGSIGKLLKRTYSQRLYEEFMQRLLSPLYDRMRDMTVELKGFEEIKFKNLIIATACQNHVKDCIDQVLQLFRSWMNTADPDSNNILPKELRSTIYCHALEYGAEEEWDFLWKRYQRSNVVTEKKRILTALGCTRKLSLLQRFLSWTIGEDAIIRKEDAFTVFDAVASNEYGFVSAKNFFYNSIQKISKSFYSQPYHVGLYINSIGSQMKTEKELEDIQSFFKKSSRYLRGLKMTINQTIERINLNIKWQSKFTHKMSTYFVEVYM